MVISPQIFSIFFRSLFQTSILDNFMYKETKKKKNVNPEKKYHFASQKSLNIKSIIYDLLLTGFHISQCETFHVLLL